MSWRRREASSWAVSASDSEGCTAWRNPSSVPHVEHYSASQYRTSRSQYRTSRSQCRRSTAHSQSAGRRYQRVGLRRGGGSGEEKRGSGGRDVVEREAPAGTRAHTRTTAQYKACARARAGA
eukprot:683764-Rhodomonas_salina.1